MNNCDQSFIPITPTVFFLYRTKSRGVVPATTVDMTNLPKLLSNYL